MFAAVMGLLPAIERLFENIRKGYKNIFVKRDTTWQYHYPGLSNRSCDPGHQPAGHGHRE